MVSRDPSRVSPTRLQTSIQRCLSLAALDREKKWKFTPIMNEGDHSSGRDVRRRDSLLDEHRERMHDDANIACLCSLTSQ